jgi:stalled ribosome rescue protein Dom34
MTSPLQAALWLDHREAKLFHVDRDGFDETKIHAPAQHVHRHGRGPGEGHQHPDDIVHFFDGVAHALAGVEELLVLGPSTAKLQFIRHLRERQPALERKVVGVESSDHPSDGQLAAHARKYFSRLGDSAGRAPEAVAAHSEKA